MAKHTTKRTLCNITDHKRNCTALCTDPLTWWCERCAVSWSGRVCYGGRPVTKMIDSRTKAFQYLWGFLFCSRHFEQFLFWLAPKDVFSDMHLPSGFLQNCQMIFVESKRNFQDNSFIISYFSAVFAESTQLPWSQFYKFLLDQKHRKFVVNKNETKDFICIKSSQNQTNSGKLLSRQVLSC